MKRYLARRFLSGIASLAVFLVISFFLFRAILPGDIATIMTSGIRSAQEREAAAQQIRTDLGLDLPVGEQFTHWIGQLARGDLGWSFLGLPVATLISVYLPATLLIFGIGLLVSFFLGLELGLIAARQKPRWLCNLIQGLALFFNCNFPPFLALVVFMALFTGTGATAVSMSSGSFIRSSMTLWRNSSMRIENLQVYLFLTILVIFALLVVALRRSIYQIPLLLPLLGAMLLGCLGWVATGYREETLDVLRISFFPFIVFVLLTVGETTLSIYRSILQVKKEEYMQAARAKGFTEAAVLRRHGLWNALLPVMSNMLVSIPFIFSGLIIVECATYSQGAGFLLYSSMMNNDMPTILGVILIIGLIVLAVRLLLDILIAVLDPRIRYDRKAF